MFIDVTNMDARVVDLLRFAAELDGYTSLHPVYTKDREYLEGTLLDNRPDPIPDYIADEEKCLSLVLNNLGTGNMSVKKEAGEYVVTVFTNPVSVSGDTHISLSVALLSALKNFMEKGNEKRKPV